MSDIIEIQPYSYSLWPGGSGDLGSDNWINASEQDVTTGQFLGFEYGAAGPSVGFGVLLQPGDLGGTLSGDLTCDTAFFQGGAFSLAGSLEANDLYVQTDTAVTVQSGATLTADDNFIIGFAGTGTATVTVESGGTLQSFATSANGGPLFAGSIGGGEGSDGATVTVTGPGATWDLNGSFDVGQFSNGTLDILNGGTVSTSVATQYAANGTTDGFYPTLTFGDISGVTGVGLVQGSGSTLNAGLGSIGIGDSGVGILTVSQGGTVTDGTFANGYDATVIGLDGGTGTLTVTGAGSTFTSVGELGVGGGSITGSSTPNTGYLFVENGATLNSGWSTIAPRGGISVGEGAGDTGYATVDGADSLINNSGRFDVGRSGLGTMTIQSGAEVTTFLSAAATPELPAGQVYAIIVGALAGSTGLLTVTGTGSTLATSQNMVVGNDGTGTLAVLAGGTVTIGTDATIGNTDTASSQGIVTIDGSGSTLAVGGNLAIGGSNGTITSTGTLIVTDSGAVSVAGALTMTSGLAAIQLDSSGEIEIGGSGHAVAGSLVVDAGSSLSGGGTITGNVELSGVIDASGGSLVISGDVTGYGTLEIAAGATADIQGSVANFERVTFAGSAAELAFGGTAMNATISGWLPTDTIDLANVSYAAGDSAVLMPGNHLEIYTSGTASILQLDQSQNFTGETFSLASDGAAGTDITLSVNPTTMAAQLAAVYQAILRTPPATTLVNQTVAQIAAGQTTLAQFESGLIASDQALYTTLPVLVTIDACFDATPQSSTLTAVAADTGSPAQVGGFYSAPYLHSLGFSDPNVWTIMASQWGADPNSAFYATYSSYGSNYSSFIAAVYQREFGFAPSATNLQNLVNDVPGVENLLAGPAGAATPIQVAGGIYGYLLYVGQTYGIGQYGTAADAFLQTVANGPGDYGPELTQQFPPVEPTPEIIEVSGSLIDPGMGSYNIQFLQNASDDTLMLHTGGVDQISGFNPTTDVLDFGAVLNEAKIDLAGGIAALGNYVTVVDQGANALVNFDPTGHGGGGTIASLLGLGSTVTGLGTLIADNAIRIT